MSRTDAWYKTEEIAPLARALPIVSKFKFVRYAHIKKKLALYVPRFNSGGPRKSGVSHFRIAKS